MEAISWATEPVVFQFCFWIFAHNLMEAMAIMVISAVYGTLPLYLADGTRKLYSDRHRQSGIVDFAGYIRHLVLSPLLHHVPRPALGARLSRQHHELGNRHRFGVNNFHRAGHDLEARSAVGARYHAMVLMGFVLYVLDGVSAIVTSNVAWSFQAPRHHVGKRTHHGRPDLNQYDVDGGALPPLPRDHGPHSSTKSWETGSSSSIWSAPLAQCTRCSRGGRPACPAGLLPGTRKAG